MRQRSGAELERLLAEAKKVRGNSLWKDARRRFRRSYVSLVSLSFLVAVTLLAVITPLLPLAPHTRVRLEEKYLSPAEVVATMPVLRATPDGDGRELAPLLGTDQLGRCLMSRILWGGRVSLLVGLVATLVSLVIGVGYGALSGYLGGRTDNLMMRAVDAMYAVPFIFVVIFLVTVIKEAKLEEQWGISRMVVFFAVIGAIYWLTMARVVRGQVLSLKHKEFVEAAQVVGASTSRILVRHLLPNVMAVVLVYLTLTIPRVMLFEAFLSFLGLGVEPPDVSWGMLAADGLGAINPLRTYWWFVLFPSLALGLTLLALNFVGDGLRDALDPRLKDA